MTPLAATTTTANNENNALQITGAHRVTRTLTASSETFWDTLTAQKPFGTDCYHTSTPDCDTNTVWFVEGAIASFSVEHV